MNPNSHSVNDDAALGLAEVWKDGDHVAPSAVTRALAKAVLRLSKRPAGPEDAGTIKLLTNLLDRGYKMHVMAGTTARISEQDSDQNDPLLAWLSDIRSVLYGKTKPTPTQPYATERGDNDGR